MALVGREILLGFQRTATIQVIPITVPSPWGWLPALFSLRWGCSVAAVQEGTGAEHQLGQPGVELEKGNLEPD